MLLQTRGAPQTGPRYDLKRIPRPRSRGPSRRKAVTGGGTDVKATTISHTRRQLMIAAVAAAATPVVTLAGSPASKAPISGVSIAQGETLLVSGRVLDAAGKPLAGARVELLQHGIAGAADG